MTSPKIEAVAWVEYAENGNARMWSGDLAAWEAVSSERTKPRNPVPLYSQQTVDALLVEVEVQRRAAGHWFTQANDSHNRAERAEAQAEANRRDAERYRWLLKNWQFDLTTDVWIWCDIDGVDSTDKISAAIDAAIAAAERGATRSA